MWTLVYKPPKLVRCRYHKPKWNWSYVHQLNYHKSAMSHEIHIFAGELTVFLLFPRGTHFVKCYPGSPCVFWFFLFKGHPFMILPSLPCQEILEVQPIFSPATYIYIYVYMYMFTHLYICKYLRIIYIYRYKYIYICIYLYIYIYIYVSIYIYIYIYIVLDVFSHLISTSKSMQPYRSYCLYLHTYKNKQIYIYICISNTCKYIYIYAKCRIHRV